MLLLPLFLLIASPRASAAHLEDSVVRISVVRERQDDTAPWRSHGGESLFGTGFVIAGNKILTNAHVVKDAREVLVRRRLEADPFVATVEAADDRCDLALLRIDDPAFGKSMRPLAINTAIPRPRSSVTTYGYPVGSQELSSTVGVVSRIDLLNYFQSGDDHLGIQTDAAINPGNSGGPVVQDGQVIGVAFQSQKAIEVESLGFVIPGLIVQHFLDDLKDGHYGGFPELGAATSPLLSKAHRRERKMPDGLSGTLVDAIARDGSGDDSLHPLDVIVSVEGQAIDNEGKIKLGESRVPFYTTIDLNQVGGTARLGIWREGARKDIVVPLRRISRWEQKRRRSNHQSPYLVYGGLVLLTVDRDYLEATWGRGFGRSGPSDIWERYNNREWTDPAHANDEVVILSRVLRHPVNSQMTKTFGIIETINGKSIRNLKEAAAAIDDARAQGRGSLVFGFPRSELEALDIVQAERAQPQILETYGIAVARRL